MVVRVLALVIGLALAWPVVAQDRERETAALLDLLNDARAHHFARDAAAVLAVQGSDFLAVNAGQVARPAPGSGQPRLQAYFDSVEFEAWDDLAPPIVIMSDDATLASVVVQKRVRTRPRWQEGSAVSETDFAWLQVWRKTDEGWRMVAVANTSTGSQALGRSEED